MIIMNNELLTINDNNIIELNGRAIGSSQRAHKALLKTKMKLTQHPELFNLINSILVKSIVINKFFITNNTIKNSIIKGLLLFHEDKIKQRDKHEDYIHTLSKIYLFEKPYLDGLEKYVDEQRISFTTKRNLFINIFLNII